MYDTGDIYIYIYIYNPGFMFLRNGKVKKASTDSSKQSNAAKPYYMDSSTESDEEDDRKLDGRVVRN